MKKESRMQSQLCGWLSLQYKHVYFTSDSSGLSAGWKTIKTIHATHSGHAQLDLIILEPMREFKGLLIELKSETPFKENGELKKQAYKKYSKGGMLLDEGDHLQDQLDTMKLLESKGYKCMWCWSFEQGQNIIEQYLGKSTVIEEPLFVY